MKVLSLICLPIVIWAAFFYFKNIFDKRPILIINKNGFIEYFTRDKLGLIKWIDIEDVIVIPYLDNTHYICIHLKNPEKYITNKRRLERIKNKKKRSAFGEVSILSTYFKKEFNNVLELMNYYIKQSKNEWIDNF